MDGKADAAGGANLRGPGPLAFGAFCALWAGCNPPPRKIRITAPPCQRAAASLVDSVESESFIFHFQPGDGGRAEVERSEAFHQWAVRYLNVTPPKKIDYYMFPSIDAMYKAIGQRGGVRLQRVARRARTADGFPASHARDRAVPGTPSTRQLRFLGLGLV